MSKINRLPKALQDYFGNTSQGVNPSELAQTVAPVVDMAPFWNADQVEYISSVGVAAAVYAFIFLPVPKGEVWMPLTMSFDITSTVVNENFATSIGIMNPGGTTRCAIATSTYQPNATAIETTTVGYNWDRIELVGSGQQFFGQVNKFDAGGVRTTGLKLRFVRLRG